MSARTNESHGIGDIIIWGAKGFAVSVIAAAVMLFAFAGICFASADPDRILPVLAYAALYVSAAFGGAVASRLSGESGVAAPLSGAASGALLLLLLILMSFLPAESRSPLSPLTTVIMYAAVPAAAALGGLLFRARPKRRMKHRRRR